MNRPQQLLCAISLCGGAVPGLFAEQKPHIIVSANKILPQAGGTTVNSVAAAPGTISFSATDPALSPFAGSSASTVTWKTSGGTTTFTWNLQVQAGATSFTNCGTVPTTAVTVTCSSVTGGTAGACKPAFALSNAGQQVATGKESSSTNAPYSVTMSFALTDSWSYIAKQVPACTLTLTYTVTAP